MHSGPSARRLLSVATAVAGGLAAAGLVMPGAAAAVPPVPPGPPPALLPDLRVTVAVTPARKAYTVDEWVKTTYTITNVGEVTATAIRDLGGVESGLEEPPTPPLLPFDLEPGESREVSFLFTVSQLALGTGYASGKRAFANDAGEANEEDNEASFMFDVPRDSGALRFKVFVDVRNDMNPNQKGLADAEVVLRTADGSSTDYRGRTDASGVVLFEQMPARQDYLASVTGWTLRDFTETRQHVVPGYTISSDFALVPGGGASTSPSPSASASASPSVSPSGSPSVSPSASESADATASPSASASATAGGTVSPSASRSATVARPTPSVRPAPGGHLARTGSDIASVAGIGVTLLVAGVVAVVATRRRPRRTPSN